MLSRIRKSFFTLKKCFPGLGSHFFGSGMLSRIGMMHQNRISLNAELYFYSGKFHSIGAGGVVLIMWTRVGSQYALKRFCAFLAQ